jgi:hypothetical protein
MFNDLSSKIREDTSEKLFELSRKTNQTMQEVGLVKSHTMFIRMANWSYLDNAKVKKKRNSWHQLKLLLTISCYFRTILILSIQLKFSIKFIRCITCYQVHVTIQLLLKKFWYMILTYKKCLWPWSQTNEVNKQESDNSFIFDDYGKSMFSTQQTIPQLHHYLYISYLLNKLKMVIMWTWNFTKN